MKTEKIESERLSTLMKKYAAEPPVAKADEESRIFAAVRKLARAEREPAIRSPWKGWLPAAAVCSALIAVWVFWPASEPTQERIAISGDVENYLKETIVAVYAEEDGVQLASEAGSPFLTLAASVRR